MILTLQYAKHRDGNSGLSMEILAWGWGEKGPMLGGLARDSRLIERVMKKSLKSFKYDLYLA